VIAVLRPWLAAGALVLSGFIALAAYAWTVDFRPPEVVSGLARASASVRLEAIAMALHREAAEMHRADVRRLRMVSAAPATLQATRFALANELRSAALLAAAEGDTDHATEWVTEASQAAPERVDLICLMTDLRTRDVKADERMLELLRLVERYDAACANLLVGQAFIEAGDTEAAWGYLERAAQKNPDWADPRLALARLCLGAGDRREAWSYAADAYRHAPDLSSRLAAAAIVRRAGGETPEPWRVIVRWAWRTGAWALPAVVAFVVLLASPALFGLGRRGVGWIRAQRGMAESAS
jgi:tetratricopeptide (TPR) repeat protein